MHPRKGAMLTSPPTLVVGKHMSIRNINLAVSSGQRVVPPSPPKAFFGSCVCMYVVIAARSGLESVKRCPGAFFGPRAVRLSCSMLSLFCRLPTLCWPPCFDPSAVAWARWPSRFMCGSPSRLHHETLKFLISRRRYVAPDRQPQDPFLAMSDIVGPVYPASLEGRFQVLVQ